MRRDVAISLATLAAALLVCVGVYPVAATFPGENGRLAYLAVSPGGGPINELAVVEANGDGAHPITQLGMHLAGPVWSPNGRKLAFFASDAARVILYTINEDGTVLTPLVTIAPGNADNGGPTWSPDGSKLAVALGGGVYLTDVRTGASTPVVANPSASLIYDQPAWSPTGERIAVRIHQQGVGIHHFRDDVGVLPATGGNVVNLTQNRNPDGALGDAGCLVRWPSWSPDGSTIVYAFGSCQRPEETFPGSGDFEARTNVRLATIHVTSGALTLLTPTALLDTRRLDNPAFSPDGARIVAEYASASLAFGLAILPAAGLPASLVGLAPLDDIRGRAPAWQGVATATGRNAIDLRFDPVRVDQFGVKRFEIGADGFQKSTAIAALVDGEAQPRVDVDVTLAPNVLVDPRLTQNPRNVLCAPKGARLWPRRFADGALDYVSVPVVRTDASGIARAHVLAGAQAGAEWLLAASEAGSATVKNAEFLRATGVALTAVDGAAVLAALGAQLAAARFTLSPAGAPGQKQDALLEWLGALRWTAFAEAAFEPRLAQIEFAPIHSADGTHAAILFSPGGSSPNPQLNYMLIGPSAGDPAGWFVLDTEVLQGVPLEGNRPRLVLQGGRLPSLAEWENAVGSRALPGRLVPQPDDDLTYFGYPYPPPPAVSPDATRRRATFARCIALPGLVVAEVHSPIDLLFVGADGRTFGKDARGFHFDGPGVLQEAGGANPIGYLLPPGSYTVTLTGTRRGAATLVFSAPTPSGITTAVFDLRARRRTTGLFEIGPDGPARTLTFGRRRYVAKDGLGLRIAGLPKKVTRDVPVRLDMTVTDQLGGVVDGARVDVLGDGVGAQAVTDDAGRASVQLRTPVRGRRKIAVGVSAAGYVSARASIKVKR